MSEKSTKTNTTSMRKFLDFLDNTPPFIYVERAALVLAGTLGLFAIADIMHGELPTALFEGSVGLVTLGVARLSHILDIKYDQLEPRKQTDLWYEIDGVKKHYRQSDILLPENK